MAETSEAVRFFESLAPDIDPAMPLRWSFLLAGASEHQVGPLIAEIESLGFSEVEPLLDEEHPGSYILGLSELCVHTSQSFAERVQSIDRLAAREGLELSDYSAGPADA